MMHGRRTTLPNWAIPALYASGAVAAGLILPRLEGVLIPKPQAGLSPGAAGVPVFSVRLVLGLLFARVGMFIALIEKLSLLQIHRMLAFTADPGRRVIEETYPPRDAPQAIGGSAVPSQPAPSGPSSRIPSTRSDCSSTSPSGRFPQR